MRWCGLGALAACASLALTACGEVDNGARTIAFLLPENRTPRYERSDRPLFEKDVKALCQDCRVVYANATGDAAKQQQQAQDALSQGADVVVLDPVDSGAAAAIVDAANAKDVPVISYDRLVRNAKPDYHVGFDNEAVGALQGKALLDKLDADGRSGGVVMINGAATDDDARILKRGAHSVLDPSTHRVVREYDTPGWAPAAAQTEMDETIGRLGENGFAGVYAADDGIAGGAIAALERAGIDPSTVSVTGQGAELAAIQRIIAGKQYVTVYRPIVPLASKAAEWAVALANGDRPSDTTFEVPVTPVTADTVEDTVVRDRYWKAGEICMGPYTEACKKYGVR